MEYYFYYAILINMKGNPGIPKSEEHRRKLSIVMKGRPGYWKGKKMPASARLAMSQSGKKKRLTQEHKDKIAKALTGRSISEETRQKFIGRKQSSETRLKKSMKQKGAKGSNWQGGVSPINERIRQSSEFKQWRAAVFARDKYTCQRCGVKYQVGNRPKLHPHHIKSFAKYPELRFKVNNGITLCEKCHKEVHQDDNGNL